MIQFQFRKQDVLAIERERQKLVERLAKRLQADGHTRRADVRVSGEPYVFHRTLEYVDLRGAPWLIKTTDDAGKATSVVYASAGTLSADSLTGLLGEIDKLVQKHGRDDLDKKSTYYSQTPVKDDNSDEWGVDFVDGGKSPTGYYGLQYGTVVGPAVSKNELKKMIKRYLSRLEGEKSTISRDSLAATDGLGSGLVEVDESRPIDVPSEVSLDPSRSTLTTHAATTSESPEDPSSSGGGLRLAVIGVGIVAALWWFFRAIKP